MLALCGGVLSAQERPSGEGGQAAKTEPAAAPAEKPVAVSPQVRRAIIPIFVCLVVGGALIWGTISLPPFGIADAPIHVHTTPQYIEMSKDHLMPPNMVSAVLAEKPDFSIESYMRQDVLLERAEDRDHLREGLIKAGLPA